MIKIIFVCLGNICRSPMAEFVMKQKVKEKNWNEKVKVCSAATSNEAEGCPIHSGTIKIFNKYGIPFENRKAIKLTKSEADKADYIVAMEESNVFNLKKLGVQSNKIFKLLDFDCGGDIADPWYTGDFERTYSDIEKGCNGMINFLETKVKNV